MAIVFKQVVDADRPMLAGWLTRPHVTAAGWDHTLLDDLESFGTAVVPEERITELVREFFLLTQKGIIETLDLRRPIYKPTAAYGHFGRSGPGFTWERTDRADALRKCAGLSTTANAEVAAHR